MDWILVLLRLTHIVAAFAWIGLGATFAFFVMPAAIRSGDNGLRFLKTLFTTTPFERLFPMMAGITMLAGLLLYSPLGNAWTHFSSTGNMVLGIGAAAGILAGIHGGAVTGRKTSALSKSLVEQVPDAGKSMDASAVSSLRTQVEHLVTDARISFVLMVIALIGMGTARYL
jgi:hypothetical protein